MRLIETTLRCFLRFHRPAVRRGAGSCWQLAAGLAVLTSVPAAATDTASQRSTFDIRPQPLDTALLEFAEQSGLQLVATGPLQEASSTTRVLGRLRNETALQQLLAGSRFQYAFQGSGTVAVSPRTIAAAAKPPARPPPDQHARHPAELSSVMVTARKRVERQIDVPIAMNVMTGEHIDAIGLASVANVLSTTAGTSSVDTGGGFTQMQIRGVSSSLGGNDNGYYLDEIPFTGVTVPWYPDARSFDLDRVEILKGPQGTLFGEGSMGGTIRVITRKPDFNFFNSQVQLSSSNTQGGGKGWGARVMLNLPLAEDKLALRVAVTDETLPGWIDDNRSGATDINTQKVKTGRVKLRFAPSAQWDIDLAWWDYRSNAPGGGYSAYSDMSLDVFFSRDSRWNNTNLVTRYDFADSQLFYAFANAHLNYHNDGMLNRQTDYHNRIGIGVRTHELRWSSTGERTLDWTLGYYRRDAMRRDSSALSNAPPSRASQTNAAYAAFGELNITLPNPAWALTAGMRYFTDDVDAASIASGQVSTLEARFNSWSPRLSLSYKPALNTTLYTSVARGFRSGQLQPIRSILLAEAHGIDLPASIAPDSIMTYEAGAKALLAQGQLMLEGAVFYSDWRGVALRVPITSSINGLVNSRGTVNKGIEASVTFLPNDALTLQLGGSLIDASYVESVPGTLVKKGAQVYNVPRFSMNGSVAYARPLGASLKAIARADWNHHSARMVSLTSGSPGDPINALNGRIGLESSAGWSAFLYGDNLSNENGAIDARNAEGLATRLRPRTIGVELNYHF